MKTSYNKNDGYRKSIEKGMYFIKSFSGKVSYGKRKDDIRFLKEKIENSDAIIVGGGSGLSTSAGLTYTGERFDKYFFDFKEKYGIDNMYLGGFFPFP